MPRGILRAAAYLPAFTDGRARLRGPDEDAFTLAATAVERLGWVPPDGSSVHIVPVGDARAVPSELWSGLLGRPVDPLGASPGDPLEWRAAVEAAIARSGPVVIVGAQAPSGGASAPSPGDGAYALLVDDIPGSSPPIGIAEGTTDPRGWPALRAARGAANLLLGDWSVNPSTGRSTKVHGQTGGTTAHLSEGAYLPPASYREGIASRWRFEADRCGRCERMTFPQRGRCRHCGSSDRLTVVSLPKDGVRAVAVTWIGPGGQPTEFDDQVAATGAYGVALVELTDGIRATVALTDAEVGTVKVGTVLSTRLRRLYEMDGSWRYGRKAVVP
jgi:uncharacterized OB-fold protein